ncbi:MULTISPECIES: hypothetical protein [Parafrankia]|nr:MULTISPECIES: hypothetical protein [Parafrankia]MBE3202221.1 hypothetical protein [Parafrankia sp. CH37]
MNPSSEVAAAMATTGRCRHPPPTTTVSGGDRDEVPGATAVAPGEP